MRFPNDFFKRATRFQHYFDPINTNPWGITPVEIARPSPIRAEATRGATSREQGQNDFRMHQSPVVKFRGGQASFNGPRPDVSGEVATPVPTGTSKRINGGQSKDRG